MKLSEILLEQWSTQQLFAGLADLAQSHTNVKNINNTVNGILHVVPQSQYSGVMYRVIYVNAKDLLNCANNSEVIKMIRDHSHAHTKKYWSFAKTTKQLQRFMDHFSNDMDVVVGVDDVDVAIILQQYGSGLDIATAAQALGGDVPTDKWEAVRVGEVLSPIDQTLRPLLYIIRGISGKGVDYEGDGDRLYKPKTYRFRTDAFHQLRDTLSNMINGVAKSVPRKNVHPRSVVRDVNI